VESPGQPGPPHRPTPRHQLRGARTRGQRAHAPVSSG
jgi:hypothetical protein